MARPGQGCLDDLATLLDYPRSPLEPLVRRCIDELDASQAAAARSALERFARTIRERSISEFQEEYTDTFDLSPSCSLDLGWHLFGGTPDRGELLVGLREALERAGVAERGELPDHLPRVLELLGREDAARAAALAGLVLPAVIAVQRALTARDSAYRELLSAVEAVVAGCCAERTSEATTS